MRCIKIYTIGFTRKSAEHFFECLRSYPITRLLDVRLHNVSQLAGFAKRDDLQYFLKTINAIPYLHQPELAPTSELLTNYKKRKGDWTVYETAFIQLMKQRAIEQRFTPDLLDGSCLLCSEHQPHQCHRRLVAEYLKTAWQNTVEIDIQHLL